MVMKPHHMAGWPNGEKNYLIFPLRSFCFYVTSIRYRSVGPRVTRKGSKSLSTHPTRHHERDVIWNRETGLTLPTDPILKLCFTLGTKFDSLSLR